MVPGIDPKIDYAFKKLFGSEGNVPLLLDLINAVLQPQPDRQIVELVILNPFSEKDALDDKLSILDVKARDSHGRHYNIEMQMYGFRYYAKRKLFYWAQLHSQQLRQGHEYNKLRETISISFVNGVLFPQVSDYWLDFQLRSSKYPELVLTDQQSMYMVELPKFKLKAEEVTSPLEAWCYLLVHGEDLDKDDLPKTLRRPPVERAMEVLSMLTQDEIERERYLSRVKAERDRISFVEEYNEQVRDKEREVSEAREKLDREREKLDREREKLDREREKLDREREKLDREREKLDREREKLDQERRERINVLIREIHLCQRFLNLPRTPTEELMSRPLAELDSTAKDLESRLGVSDL